MFFCNEHLNIKAAGDTKLDAMRNWNRQNWKSAFTVEHEVDEAEADD